MTVTEFLHKINVIINCTEDYKKTGTKNQHEKTCAEAVSYDDIKDALDSLKQSINENTDIL